MRIKKYIWPIFGLIVTVLSIRMLYHEFTDPNNALSQISLHELFTRLSHLSWKHWLMACFFTLLAYAALAAYDCIALHHLKKDIPWHFIAICSFTTYALSHNIGASVFSGAAIRFRAYSLKGLSASDVAVLVAFCSFTFTIGVFFLATIVLFNNPDLFAPLQPYLSDLFSNTISVESLKHFSIGLACFFIFFIFMYILGSWMRFKPLKIFKNITINYPRLHIVCQQLIIGPLEIIGAAGIIYSALPSSANVSFLLVLGAFLLSFSIGLLSNAPGGGLGILEISFINILPQIDAGDLLVALIVFRILYLIIPLIISLFFVGVFEINQYRRRNELKP